MPIALADLVDPKQITLSLRARTEPEAASELVDLLIAAGRIETPKKFLEQLRAREAVNSTYAADGVAFPHARTKLVDQIVLAIGRSESGVPWTGKGEMAHLIFLIAVPERRFADWIRFSGGMNVRLACRRDALDRWWRSVAEPAVRRRPLCADTFCEIAK